MRLTNRRKTAPCLGDSGCVAPARGASLWISAAPLPGSGRPAPLAAERPTRASPAARVRSGLHLAVFDK